MAQLDVSANNSYTITSFFPRRKILITSYPNRENSSHSQVTSLFNRLFDNASAETGGDSAATLADVESLTDLNGVGLVHGDNHLDVVTRHDSLGGGILSTLREGQVDRLISSSEVQLGSVVLLEASVSATLLLGQDVEGSKKLGVGLDSAGGADDHATADILAADTTDEKTGVVTSLGTLAGLLEGLNVGDLGLHDLLALTDKLNVLIAEQGTALDTARDDSSTPSNREDILNGHEEGLVKITDRGGDPGVDGLEQLINSLVANLGALVVEGHESRAHDDGGLVTLEAVGGEELTHLHLDELQHLRVINGIDLVDKDDNPLDTDLAGEQQVLSGLGHLPIRSSDDNDGTVHVGGTSNHVFDVIGVARAVDVRVVAVFGGVLDVSGGNGDTTLSLLGSLVNGTIVEEVGKALFGLTLGDGSGESGLAVIDVADGTNVNVGLSSLEDGV